jgi:membrane protease YdiL (CAAX protease family)
MGFFTRHKGRGSYDLLSNYNHFMPGFGDLGLVVIFLIIGSVLGGLILSGFIAAGFGKAVGTYGMLIAYPMMFIPAMLYASSRSRRNEGFEDGYTLDNNNFGSHRWYTMTYVAIAMSLATAFVIEPISMLLPEMSEDMVKKMEIMMGGPAWVTFISVSIFAPFFEEWLCRGVVLRGLLKKVKPMWAITLSALFFALIHMNLWQAIPAFLMGLVFGYVYYKTGSLKLTMLMHFANNTMAFIISLIPSLKDADYFSDAMLPWAYACIYAAATVTIIFGFILLKGITTKNEDLGGCRLIKSIF